MHAHSQRGWWVVGSLSSPFSVPLTFPRALFQCPRASSLTFRGSLIHGRAKLRTLEEWLMMIPCPPAVQSCPPTQSSANQLLVSQLLFSLSLSLSPPVCILDLRRKSPVSLSVCVCGSPSPLPLAEYLPDHTRPQSGSFLKTLSL